MNGRTAASRLLVVALLGTTGPSTAQTGAPQRASISASDLRSDVAFLASDDMRGRLTGSRENRLAAAFIRARFERLGLSPVADDNYLMPFELIVPAMDRDDTHALNIRVTGEAATQMTLGRDYYPERMSGSTRARGTLVYVGFGVSAPGLDHNDYASIDVTGRIVVLLNHEPGEFDAGSPFDGRVASEHGRTVRKVLEAQRRGAVAVLVVADVHNHENGPTLGALMDATWPAQPGRVPTYELGAWIDAISIPVVRISPDVAARALNETPTGFEALAQRADTDGFTAIAIETEIEVATEITRRRVTQHNVVGLLDGGDPELRDEWVIMCAHFDHEGANGDRIFNGADDDASGIAGLLDIAEAYTLAARTGIRPRRSILFAAWNAEERGLLGAWAYTEHPLTPLSDTVAVLNMDMIGRNEEVPARGGPRFRGLPAQTAASNRNAVNVLGYSFSDDLRRAAAAAYAEGLTLHFRYDRSTSNLLRRSDHWPFLASGVPALFVHTGLHPDYHTERDRPETLDYEKMARVVQWVHELGWNLANADGRPGLN